MIERKVVGSWNVKACVSKALLQSAPVVEEVPHEKLALEAVGRH